jgi:hypothetical protein
MTTTNRGRGSAEWQTTIDSKSKSAPARRPATPETPRQRDFFSSLLKQLAANSNKSGTEAIDGDIGAATGRLDLRRRWSTSFQFKAME